MSNFDTGTSLQEQDLALFLTALGVVLPGPDPLRADGYTVITLGAAAAEAFDARDSRTVLLGYRLSGRIFPLSIHFLSGEKAIQFGHSTLLLESYGGDTAVVSVLRKAVERFFSQDGNAVLRRLDPAWEGVVLTGQLDRRIEWHMKPTARVAADALAAALGTVPEIPLFPSVYGYNNPYVENLLEVGLPELAEAGRVLVLGTGSGLDAVCIASKYRVPVDATDINPVAVANTQAAARRCGVEALVRAYVSDGFDRVDQTFDAIFFEAPLATSEEDQTDINRYDFEGALLRRVLAGLPSRLKPNGRMYLMSRPDISPYIASTGIHARARRDFEPKSKVAIHEVRLVGF